MILPDVKPHEFVVTPEPPTAATLLVYIALKRGVKRFGEFQFECSIPPEKVRDQSVLHMSSIGSCGRKQWYQLNYPESYALLDTSKPAPYLHLGQMIEAYTVTLLTLGGLPPYDTQRRVQDRTGRVVGHIDGLIDVQGEPSLIEIKGLRHQSVELLVHYGLERAIPMYHAQMQYYLASLEIEYGYLIVLDKNTSEWYIERVARTEVDHRYLHDKALAVLLAPKLGDIPEGYVVRDCRWCPLQNECVAVDGEKAFIKKFITYQESRP